MTIKIRLARGGRKGKPFYRINVTNSKSARDGKFIEKIGTYNPLIASDNEQRVILNKDRAEYWISVGAQPSRIVAKFLCDFAIKGAEKYKPEYKSKKKGEGAKKKAQERIAQAKEAEEESKAKKEAEAVAEKASESQVQPEGEQSPEASSQAPQEVNKEDKTADKQEQAATADKKEESNS